MAKPRKNVRFTVILLDNKRFPKIVRAPANTAFTDDGIEALLNQEASIIERYFPGREFRLVPLAGGDFNFIEMAQEEAKLRSRQGELQESYAKTAEAVAV